MFPKTKLKETIQGSRDNKTNYSVHCSFPRDHALSAVLYI